MKLREGGWPGDLAVGLRANLEERLQGLKPSAIAPKRAGAEAPAS